MKQYTFITTYIVKAEDEEAARLVVNRIHIQLGQGDLIKEYWTTLTDVEDDWDEETTVP
ncbi:hypothetical protein LCGC14_1799670 [marine sediment metagenome]|uniref:Uncharacterized protein n=1 Tax=marine sediment metagenome TaxID=412755 RepID=A0A0F9GQ49_9ZZZZ